MFCFGIESTFNGYTLFWILFKMVTSCKTFILVHKYKWRKRQLIKKEATS